MPFASEKQRRYLWMHEPEVAKKWSHEYGSKPKKKKKKVKEDASVNSLGAIPTVAFTGVQHKKKKKAQVLNDLIGKARVKPKKIKKKDEC